MASAQDPDRPGSGSPMSGRPACEDQVAEGRSGVRPAPAPAGGPTPVRPRHLVLDDPLSSTASEDRPESWGDRSGSEAQRLAEYERDRPPHHGD
jgi:hypothetical protein